MVLMYSYVYIKLDSGNQDNNINRREILYDSRKSKFRTLDYVQNTKTNRKILTF